MNKLISSNLPKTWLELLFNLEPKVKVWGFGLSKPELPFATSVPFAYILASLPSPLFEFHPTTKSYYGSLQPDFHRENPEELFKALNLRVQFDKKQRKTFDLGICVSTA